MHRAARDGYTHRRRRSLSGARPMHHPRSRTKSRSRSHSRGFHLSHQNEYSQPQQEGQPMMTFREFVLTLQDDEEDASRAVQEYEQYKTDYIAKHAKTFFNRSKYTGYMLENYFPEQVHRRFLMRREVSQKRAAAVFKSFTNRAFQKLRFVAPPPRGSHTSDLTSQVHPRTIELEYGNCRDDEPPYFFRNPKTNSVMVRNVPLDISIWDLKEAIGTKFTVENISFMPPAASDPYYRDAWIEFGSVSEAAAAATELHRTEVKEIYTMDIVLNHPRRSYKLKICPGVMSRPARIRKDIEVSAKLIKKFDEYWGIHEALGTSDSPFRNPILAEGMELHNSDLPILQHQLDCQLLYLRRVHSICYYSGQAFDSEHLLFDKCGAAFCRQAFPALLDVDAVAPEGLSEEQILEDRTGGDEAEQNNQWVQRLNSSLEEILDRQLEVVEPITENDPLVESQWDSFCSKSTVHVDSEKWRCSLCKKLFRGPEFVHKHLKNKHKAALDQIIRQVSETVMEKRYLEDPNKLVAFPRQNNRASLGYNPGRYNPTLTGRPRRRSDADRDYHTDGHRWENRTLYSSTREMYSDMMLHDQPNNEVSGGMSGRFRRHYPLPKFYDRDEPHLMESSYGTPLVAQGQLRSTIRYDDL